MSGFKLLLELVSVVLLGLQKLTGFFPLFDSSKISRFGLFEFGNDAGLQRLKLRRLSLAQTAGFSNGPFVLVEQRKQGGEAQ